jgi:hypothetical protein
LLLPVLVALLGLAPGVARAADPLQNAYGGTYTTPSGGTVAVYTSSLLPADDTVNQHWADFLDSLVHGPELAQLTLVLEPLGQVQQHCGLGAYACYRADRGLIVASPDKAPPDGPTPEGVVAHEYGHHVAAHRTNAPWSANAWGTKRWATAMGICAKVRAGQLHPGDESAYYLFNPGEAFAESYRLLNESQLQLPLTPWRIVSPKLQPSQTALDALRADVQDPWLAPTTRTVSSFFTPTGTSTRTFSIATPYDGAVVASLKAPAGTTLRISVGGLPTNRGTVCGQRTTRVTVTRIRGRGAFTLTVQTP